MTSTLTSAQADFAVRLLKALDEDETNSIVLSPLSLFYMMAICAEGSGGNTQNEILYCLTQGMTHWGLLCGMD